ncbi:15-hydroxyprostaglandin dehydrogenase [NAD(+)]-like [Ptychodera flava]|uniref:15-hydroxyprostaglandin dehydrogenase [NAD(+)]-like n=1 Tax=Ptychodera flava TaxID=63121 RepID=UPI003969DD7D
MPECTNQAALWVTPISRVFLMSNCRPFDNKMTVVQHSVSLITGAARGIGRGLSEMLLQRDALGVSIIDIDKEAGLETTAELKKLYGDDRVLFVECDVRDENNLRAAYEQTKKKFGRLDIVCNNAAIFDDFKLVETIDVNLTSLIRSTYMAVEYMGIQHGGHGGVIINVSSILGLIPNKYVPIYTATKHGVVGFSRSAAEEQLMKDNGISIASYCVGKVNTDMILAAKQSSRYGQEFEDRLANMGHISVQESCEGILQMIEDKSVNGKANIHTLEIPMMNIQPPDFMKI